MLLLNAAALAIFAGTAVQAAMWNIEVGANGLIFNPPSIIAAPADIIVFTLYVVSPYPPIPYPLLTLPPADPEPILSLSQPSQSPALRLLAV